MNPHSGTSEALKASRGPFAALRLGLLQTALLCQSRPGLAWAGYGMKGSDIHPGRGCRDLGPVALTSLLIWETDFPGL